MSDKSGGSMKALTISQPYASLIASGEKWVENRTWSTEYRGLMAIHAGLGKQYLSKEKLSQFPTGVVIAVAELAACIKRGCIETVAVQPQYRDKIISGTSRTWFDLYVHPHSEGPWCWILENVRLIEHISAKGKQQLWTFDQPFKIVDKSYETIGEKLTEIPERFGLR